MPDVRMPVKFYAVAVVRRDSPAWNWFRENSRHMRPGAIIPATDEEFASLAEDVRHVQLFEPPSGEAGEQGR